MIFYNTERQFHWQKDMEQDFGFGPNDSYRTHGRSLLGIGPDSEKIVLFWGGGRIINRMLLS